MQKVHFFSKCTMARIALVAIFAFVSLSALAQNKVSGTVTDKATGEPLTGVTVLEKGTSNGIATDFNGNYTISVGTGKALVFSYIGYKTEEVVVNSSVVNVQMTEDAAMLDEVVVIGYGTMQRKDLTGSISTVNAKDLNVGIYTDPAQMLQGKVAGLSIVQSSDPNAGTTSITLDRKSVV